jgi:hypothetical protein
LGHWKLCTTMPQPTEAHPAQYLYLTELQVSWTSPTSTTYNEIKKCYTAKLESARKEFYLMDCLFPTY